MPAFLCWSGRVDYPPEPDTQLLFSSEVSRICVNISVIDDIEMESTEVFAVSLSADFDIDTVLIQPDTTLVIILDDDDGDDGGNRSSRIVTLYGACPVYYILYL